jgi:tetratricopeptide (TPR) repeat protein
MLPPREAALSLCALAELADDHHIYRDRIADLYREARRLDPECAPAAEAVKGIGRRLGRLRPAAALLQDDQEATWTAAARAIRLIELARQSPIGSDSARDLYGRALALDPDQVEAWRGASAATQAAGDTQQASRLLLQAVHAWHRTHAPDGQAAGVDLMVEAAELARVAGDSDACLWLCTEIIEHDPTRVTAALVVARKWADEGAPATALALLEPLLVVAAEPDPELLSLAADLAAATGDAAAALNWRTRALGERPLLSAALESLAMEQAHTGLLATAVNLAAASLVQQTDLSRRAETLCRMGTWLDDGKLACHDEALACFEEAFALGYRRRDVLERLHEHYRTHSAGARGEEIVQALLETETDEARRAVLTLALARTRAERPGDEVRARSTIEAALEVQPASLELRRMLVAVLERQNDRPALRSVLEQLAHQADAHEAARIWLQLADLARQGGEPDASVMELLERSARACATTEALEQIEAHYAEHEPASSARLHNLARLAEVSERPYRHVIEVGRLLFDQHPRQVWCMLAPLLMIRQGEEDLRARLRELRRDHERPPLLVADAAARRNLFPQGTPGHAVALLDALRLIENEVFVGARSTAELGAQEVFEVSLHSAIGRTFVSLAEAMGISGASLHRANSLAEPCMVWFRGQTVAVVLRSDILQSMARAEIGFVLVSALELAQPGGRVLASMVGERLHGVVAAIRRGLDLPADSPADPEVCSIVEALSADTREAAKALLTPFVSIDDETMLRDTRRALQGRAHAAGLVAGADLSQIFRVLGRMNGDGDWGGAFANASAIDDLLLHAEAQRHLTAFAASPIFGELLLRSAEVSA